eukprot:903261-Rhodomonas_salina.2
MSRIAASDPELGAAIKKTQATKTGKAAAQSSGGNDLADDATPVPVSTAFMASCDSRAAQSWSHVWCCQGLSKQHKAIAAANDAFYDAYETCDLDAMVCPRHVCLHIPSFLPPSLPQTHSDTFPRSSICPLTFPRSSICPLAPAAWRSYVGTCPGVAGSYADNVPGVAGSYEDNVDEIQQVRSRGLTRAAACRA